MSVYDMTPEIYPELFRLGNPHFAKRRYAEVADRIISISENTAKDMYRFYSPELEKKTVVIPLGVSEQFFHPGPVPADLPERYVLFVGVRGGYKEFATALKAFAEVAKEDATVHLVVAGGGPLTAAEGTEIAALGVTDRVHTVRPTDAEMPALYGDAAVFVFPSRYEGFGLPTIEAFAVGTPVILADASCSREVGGDLAIYFTPGDVAQLAAQLRRVLAGEAVEQTRSDGPRHARRFDWPTVAQRTAEVYRELLAERTRRSG
jgi:glycosyltransferase involved in cell wall biosynthesis